MKVFSIDEGVLLSRLTKRWFKTQLSKLAYESGTYCLGESPDYEVRNFSGTPSQRPIRTGEGWWLLYWVDWVLWAFFRNDLDGVIGDKNWNPEQKDTWGIRLKWWLRNPCHNLTWYVLGFADRSTIRVDFPSKRPTVDDPEAGWSSALSLVPTKEDSFGIMIVRLYPYVQYRGKRVIFYLGWRGRGTLGCKLNLKLK